MLYAKVERGVASSLRVATIHEFSYFNPALALADKKDLLLKIVSGCSTYN